MEPDQAPLDLALLESEDIGGLTPLPLAGSIERMGNVVAAGYPNAIVQFDEAFQRLKQGDATLALLALRCHLRQVVELPSGPPGACPCHHWHKVSTSCNGAVRSVSSTVPCNTGWTWGAHRPGRSHDPHRQWAHAYRHVCRALHHRRHTYHRHTGHIRWRTQLPHM